MMRTGHSLTKIGCVRTIGQRGITLIELMIVITVLGLLASFATSLYANARVKTYRSTAMTALGVVSTNQEDFFASNLTFTDDFADLGFPAGSTHNGVYLLDFIGTPDTLSYTIRARPAPGGGSNGVDQSSDEACQWFTQNNLGVKQSGPDPHCWAQ